MRTVLFNLLRPVLAIFYDRAHLSGRWFSERRTGYKWAIEGLLYQRLLGINRAARFPCGPWVRVLGPHNIEFHPDDLNNFQSMGIYFQASKGRIVIGRGSFIGPNVGLITANHDVADPSRHTVGQDIVLGERCWIGMNAVILPGVTLGPGTVVGAGSVVRHSFPDGHCVLAGSPAREVRKLSHERE